jgi:hypothetical protein
MSVMERTCSLPQGDRRSSERPRPRHMVHTRLNRQRVGLSRMAEALLTCKRITPSTALVLGCWPV